MVDITPARRAPPSPPPPGPQSLDLGVVSALQEHLRHARMVLAWGASIAVLAPVRSCSDMELIAHRRILEDPRSMMVLQVLWRESRYIDRGVLEAVGSGKVFPAPPTCHALAVMLSPDAATLGKTEKRLQKVVKASRDLGLLDVVVVTSKRHELHASALLNTLMMRLGGQGVSSAGLGDSSALGATA